MAFKTLYLAISGHGYGHAGQVAPVVGELRRLRPDLRVVVHSSIPRTVLEGLLGMDFEYQEGTPEPTVRMFGPLDLDIANTLEAYSRYHAEFRTHLDREKALIQQSGADIVLADIPYTPIRAASELGVPCIALCSLNWADILGHYTREARIAEPAFVDEIRRSYASACSFIAPAPSMEMDWLTNLEFVGPVARQSTADSVVTRRYLGVAQDQHLVLATMGGIRGRGSRSDYPRADDLRWVVPDDCVPAYRPDVIGISRAGIPFIDVLAACDAVATKPGYGMFVEAASHGVPVVYVERPDWPESSALGKWLANWGVGIRITRSAYDSGSYLGSVRDALAQPRPDRFIPSGANEAAEIILGQVR